MRAVRRTTCILIYAYLHAAVFPLPHANCSVGGTTIPKLREGSITASVSVGGGESTAAALSGAPVTSSPAMNISDEPQRRPQTHKSSAKTLRTHSPGDSPESNKSPFGRKTERNSFKALREVSAILPVNRPSGTRYSSRHAPNSVLQNANRKKRIKRRSELTASLSPYAKQLVDRSLVAGNGVLALLECVQKLSPDRASLLLKLFRTWPDIQKLLHRYGNVEEKSQEQLLTALVQYRARAIDLAARPQPPVFAWHAVQTYLDVGEPIFHNVMAKTFSSIVRGEPTGLQFFKDCYLPLLQGTLAASVLMLHGVRSSPSKDCLNSIERRVRQLERLGSVAQSVKEKWENLACSEAVGAS